MINTYCILFLYILRINVKRYNILEVMFSLEIKSKSKIKNLLFSSMTWDVMVDTSSSSSISVLRKRILPKKGRGRIFFYSTIFQTSFWVWCESRKAFIVYIEWWGLRCNCNIISSINKYINCRPSSNKYSL